MVGSPPLARLPTELVRANQGAAVEKLWGRGLLITYISLSGLQKGSLQYVQYFGEKFIQML